MGLVTDKTNKKLTELEPRYLRWSSGARKPGDMKQRQNQYNMYTRGDMSQGHVAATRLLVCVDNFELVKHEFCSLSSIVGVK